MMGDVIEDLCNIELSLRAVPFHALLICLFLLVLRLVVHLANVHVSELDPADLFACYLASLESRVLTGSPFLAVVAIFRRNVHLHALIATCQQLFDMDRRLIS